MKYRNKPLTIDGIRFASRAEGARYLVLKMQEQHGDITNLKLQPSFKLYAGIRYRADFEYFVNGKRVIEDVKGMETQVFKLKKKLMKAAGFAITVIKMQACDVNTILACNRTADELRQMP